MLKKLLVLMNKETDNVAKDCGCEIITDEADASPADTLVASDDVEIIEQYRERGYATLGVSEDEDFFPGTFYITDSILECDYSYLNSVFCHTHGIPVPILETDRTIVREMSLQDLPLLYEMYDDDLIRENVEPLYDYDEEAEYTKNYINNMYCMLGFGVWLVFDKATGKLCGRCGLSVRELDKNTVIELGYVIGRDFRKQGYATEVCEAIIDYSRDELGMDELHIITKEVNTISVKVAERLGFSCVAEGMLDGEKHLIFSKNL